MYRTTKIHITHNTAGGQYMDILKKLCYHSARMYNVGLYSVRQHFFNTQSYISYYENYNLCKNNENYKLIYSSTAQQILRLVDRDMQSFFHLLKLKKQGRYDEKVKLPKYKNTEGVAMYIAQSQACRVHGDKIRHGLTKAFRETYSADAKYIEFTCPSCVDLSTLKEMRIIPKFGGAEFVVEFVYSKAEAEPSHSPGILSIDPGLSNLMTCTSFSGSTPSESFIIDGRYIKNVNYYYNKAKARLQSMYDLTGVKGTTRRMRRLSNGRNNRIDAYFNEVCRYICNYCKSNGIGTVVMGYNEGQKQEINIGKVNNQNYVMIPLHKLRQKLLSYCESNGISCVFQEESYTSKCCCLSLDAIPVYSDGVSVDDSVFHGKRVKRGLYRCDSGEVINADVNGSINIFRKYLKSKSKMELSVDDVRAFVNRPVCRVNVLRH